MSDRLPCPHCGEMFTDLWDYDWSDREVIYAWCSYCLKSVDIVRHVTVDYVLRVPDASEEDDALEGGSNGSGE